jgi:hypothetical protein
MDRLQEELERASVSIKNSFSREPAGRAIQSCHIPDDAPGSALAEAAVAVNQSGSAVNCGTIADVVVARLRGTDPDAVASPTLGGSFQDIETRFNTKLQWDKSFEEAFSAVKAGGDGTQGIIGVIYPRGGSHVVAIANDRGKVGIVEGQNCCPDRSAGVSDSPAAADARYNPDGESKIGYGIIPP